MKILVAQDPGHAWAIVDADWLASLGIQATEFSEYSYRSRDNVLALEEDCDLPLLVKRLEEVGVKVELVTFSANQRCNPRSWGRIH